MKFYIVDDDINIVQIISNLIEDMDLGTVVGTATNPHMALSGVLNSKVDICLVDFLMPHMDGSEFMTKVKMQKNTINFIMISQVSDASMVALAYNMGVEFFIHKPLNTVEFKNVVEKVVNMRKMKAQIEQIKLFLDETTHNSKAQCRKISHYERMFMELGILGEKGTQDLLRVLHSLENTVRIDEKILRRIVEQDGKRAKIVYQRMRRALSKSLNNIAYLGLEDYSHELFTKYAYKYFSVQSVSEEIAYIKGKAKSGGKINLLQFVSSAIIEAREL